VSGKFSTRVSAKAGRFVAEKSPQFRRFRAGAVADQRQSRIVAPPTGGFAIAARIEL
jgi:hypothetical protein